MPKCQECDDKATHKYRTQDGFSVWLCDKHYNEWTGKSDYKLPPFSETLQMRLIWLVKWGIRLVGVLVMIPAGILFIGFVVYALVVGLPIVYSFRIWLIFTEIHLQGEGAATPSIFGIVLLLVGIVLTYIGFMKME